MNDTSTADQANRAIKRLVVLGLLLQALHVLFGITAIMGMLITHTQIARSQGTIYHSHLRWQLITFWVAAALYAIALTLWYRTGTYWPTLVVFLLVIYRIGTGIYYYRLEKPMNRAV